jgi:mono/diheme cytochrome c family protein
MHSIYRRLGVAVGLLALTALTMVTSVHASNRQIARGKYLVALGGCEDCHTPGHFFGKPDMTRDLGGSDVGFEIPGLGVFVGRNLTPDNETGLGKWTAKEIVTALTAGKRPDGRVLAPIMPWRAFAHLTKSDAYAIAAYLKSLRPVRNDVPGPFGPNDAPTVFVMKIVPGSGMQPAPAAAHK